MVLGWEAGLAEGIILKKIVQRNNSGSSNWLCHEVCCSSTGRWEWQEPALGEPSSALTSQGKSCWCLYLQGVYKATPCAQSTLLLPGANSNRNTGIDTPWAWSCPSGLGNVFCPVGACRCQVLVSTAEVTLPLRTRGQFFIHYLWKPQGKHQNPQKAQSWRNFASVLGSSSDCIPNLLLALFLQV